MTLPPAQSPGRWLSHTDLEPRLSPSAPQPGRGFLAFIRQEFWQTSGCPAGEEGRLEEASTACTFPALCSVTPHKPEKGAPQPGSQRRPLRPRAHQPPGRRLPGRISSTGLLCRGSLAECQRRGPHEFEKSDGGHPWLGEASKDRQGASELEAERQERHPPRRENRWARQDAHMKTGNAAQRGQGWVFLQRSVTSGALPQAGSWHKAPPHGDPGLPNPCLPAHRLSVSVARA